MGLICTMAIHVVEVMTLRFYLWCRGIPEPTPPAFTPEEQKLIRQRLDELVPFVPVRDPTPFLRRVWFHLVGFVSVCLDMATMQRRRLAQNDADFSPEVSRELQRFPEYYRKNFHYQTDGYFTLASARRYDMQYELIFLGIGQRIRRVAATQLRRFLEPDRPYAMLEVGAGPGNLGAIMQGLYPGTEVLLTDPSVPYLQYALEKYPHMKIRSEPTFLEDLSFVEPASLDVLMSGFLFHELPVPVMHDAIAESFRVLKPGGFMFVLDSSQDHDGQENHFALNQFQDTYHEPYYDDFRGCSLEAFLEEAGYEVVHHQLLGFSKVVIAQKLPLA